MASIARKFCLKNEQFQYNLYNTTEFEFTIETINNQINQIHLYMSTD